MTGSAITISRGKLKVPDNPIIPFIEGDGTGPDIWAASVRVLDAAVEKAYGGKKKIVWQEVLAGEKAYNKTGSWLPDETLKVIDEYKVAIKGPLTTPVGGGIRSLNVALRQMLDLYVCLRPVRWFKGVPSPVKQPGLAMPMVRAKPAMPGRVITARKEPSRPSMTMTFTVRATMAFTPLQR